MMTDDESSVISSNSANIPTPTLSILPDIPKLNYSEIVLGKVIGTGGFSRVYAIRNIKLDPKYNDDNVRMNKLRFDIANAGESSFSHTIYVLKALKPELADSEQTKGIVDLAVEARFLASLCHPNIISMRATADVDPLESNFFVILDSLTKTLDKTLLDWRRQVTKAKGFLWCCCLGYVCCTDRRKLHQIWLERMTVATAIANAIQYLHSNDMLYRDLKPDNVGFDKDGTVKIFDFGLAKRLHPDDRCDNTDLYNLTGNTGSLRYMAPEVALGKPYNNRVDTYSFGILFWQLCSLTTPYSGYSCKMHADLVVAKGHRPKPDRTWPETWVQLMEDCWETDIFLRPNFDYITDVLTRELTSLSQSSTSSEFPDHRRVDKVKAKKKKRPIKGAMLDVDTRISGKTPDEDDHLIV